LKENFSRFNFALYKEKEMADFRRWFIALAVLALMAGLASAQIGTSGSTTVGALTCTANGAVIPTLRIEGFTELLGDVLISCTGGPTYAQGAVIPTTNITVLIPQFNYPITSRLFSSSSGLSEVALIIDEPGSGLSTGSTGGFGPAAPQKLCTNGAGCPAVVGMDGSGTYEVAMDATAPTTQAHNIYRGYLGQLGANSVTFYGVPVLPPVTSGVSRVFRVTNIRYPVTQIASATVINAQVTTAPSQVLPLIQSYFPVGIVFQGLKASVSTPVTFPQCQPQFPSGSSFIPQASSTLSFTEGFATSFKTRVVPGANSPSPSTPQYAAEAANTGVQNIPGGLYAGFASNSESGFIVPGDTFTTGGNTYTAGLADFGTRLKAVFTNIPAGITLYVSTVNVAISTSGVVTPPSAGSTTFAT
jgi:hypothetical protein